MGITDVDSHWLFANITEDYLITCWYYSIYETFLVEIRTCLHRQSLVHMKVNVDKTDTTKMYTVRTYTKRVSTDGTLVAGRAIRPQRYPKISVDIQNFP
jgi:hypothetical protein